MKSPMVENLSHLEPDEEGSYSELQVLQSAAGYYIGTMFTHTGGRFKGLVEPGSRDSDYFPTFGAAETFLKTLENGENHDKLHQTPQSNLFDTSELP